MSLDLPKELYLYIFVLADDLDSTKSLRSVSKTACSASYDYFKLLLREPIFINDDDLNWYIFNNNANMSEIIKKQEVQGTRKYQPCHQKTTIDKSLAFKTTISDLFRALNSQGDKVIFEF